MNDSTKLQVIIGSGDAMYITSHLAQDARGMKKKCEHKDCNETATHFIYFELVAVNNAKANSTPVLWVCTEHALDTKSEDVIDERGWRDICTKFNGEGYATPSREKSSIRVVAFN